MSRYAKARTELEHALVGRPYPAHTETPTRYAAISVRQPWAWLLAHAPEWPDHVLGKTLENRSRPTNYRGPLLIHVSRTWDGVGETLLELRKLGLVGRGCPEPTIPELRAQLGQVIAVAELGGCRRVGNPDPSPWAIPGQWAWELDAVELVRPFELRGRRGLWFAPEGLEVVRLSRKLELRALPVPREHHIIPGLRFDRTTGETSIEVRDHRDAIRILLRAGVRHLGLEVLVNGHVTHAGELLARAAAELGDPEAASRIRAQLPRDLVPALPSSHPTRGPREHACIGGRHA